MHEASPRRRYRSIFLSDVHLGTKGCRSDYLVDRYSERKGAAEARALAAAAQVVEAAVEVAPVATDAASTSATTRRCCASGAC